MVALLTPQSVRSAFVLSDLGAAWALGKPIISLITRRDVLNTIPLAMNESQMIELTDVEFGSVNRSGCPESWQSNELKVPCPGIPGRNVRCFRGV